MIGFIAFRRSTLNIHRPQPQWVRTEDWEHPEFIPNTVFSFKGDLHTDSSLAKMVFKTRLGTDTLLATEN